MWEEIGGDGGNRTRVQQIEPEIDYKLSQCFSSRRLVSHRQDTIRPAGTILDGLLPVPSSSFDFLLEITKGISHR